MKNKKLDLHGIKAVIFDMDGTMVDNNVFHKKAFQEFCRRHGYKLSDEEFHKRLSGKKNKQIFIDLFEGKLSEEEIQQYSDEKEALYRELYAPHLISVTGLLDLVQKLQEKKMKLAIATTANEENRAFILEKLGLSAVFDAIVGDEHVIQGKPNSEVYLKAAKALEIDPTNCLAFEDTPAGVKAAKSAGMKVIGLATTHSADELNEANLVINNFSELAI